MNTTTFSGLSLKLPTIGGGFKRGIIGEEGTITSDKPFMPTMPFPISIIGGKEAEKTAKRGPIIKMLDLLG